MQGTGRAQRKRKSRELHQQIREITGKPKINTGSLKSRAGIDYIEKDKNN
jgi:hypothetical protein